MQAKLKYTLPLTQMALAAVLIWVGQLFVISVMRRPHYSLCAGMQDPFFTLFLAINAPILPLRAFMRYFSWWADGASMVIGSGVLWYWVMLQADSWRRNRTVFTFSWLPLRFTADTVLIATGVLVAWFARRSVFVGSRIGSIDFYTFYFREPWQSTLLCVALLTFLLTWSFVLIFFFGRDLLSCIPRAKHRCTQQQTGERY